MDNCKTIDCFRDLIGVYGCHNDGSCRYFINDISGISSELLRNITDEDRSSYLQVFNKALQGAISTLKIDAQDILLKHRERMEFAGEIFRSQQPRAIHSQTVTFPDANFVGVLLTTAPSRYVIAEIGAVSIMPSVTTTVTPIIFDFESREVLDEGEPLEVIGGKLSEFNFDYTISTAKHRAIFIGFQLEEGAQVSFTKLNCNRFEHSDCQSCLPCESVCSDGETGEFKQDLENILEDKVDEFAIYSVTAGDLSNFNTYEQVDSKTPVCAAISLVCSMDQFVCDNAKRLAEPLQYLVARNILTEKMGSFRLNMWAKGNMEFTAMRREELQNEYKGLLKKVVPTLPLTGDSLCWKCEQGGIYTESLI